MRGRPEFYVRVMCPPYTAEDAEFLAERNKVLEEAVNRIAAENFELREDNRNLKESYRYLSTTRIEEKKELKEQSEKSILYRTTVGVTQLLAVVELIEKEPAVEKEYDVMFSGTEHIDSPGPAPAVGYRIAAKSWEEAVQKGKFYAEMQHPAFIPFAFAGPVIEVPKEELENLETEKK